MMRKGQAALEFLMTYGWAILIVIAVIAALYMMGIFSMPSGGLSPCSPCFPAGSAFAYVDHSDNTLVLTVGPKTVKAVYVTVGSNNIESAECPSTNENLVCDSGSKVSFTSSGAFGGSAVEVTVHYKDVASGLEHTAGPITLHTK